MIHELKTWPEPYAAVRDGTKMYEIRVPDRPFAVGDTLILKEWDPTTKTFTGHSVERVVSYLTPGGQWGLPVNVCVMSLRRP